MTYSIIDCPSDDPPYLPQPLLGPSTFLEPPTRRETDRILSGLPPEPEGPVALDTVELARSGDPVANEALIDAFHPHAALHMADWLRCKGEPFVLWAVFLDAGLRLPEEDRLIHPGQLIRLLDASWSHRGDGLPIGTGEAVELYRAGLSGDALGWVLTRGQAESDAEARVDRGLRGGFIHRRVVERRAVRHAVISNGRAEVFVSSVALGSGRIDDWSLHPLARIRVRRRRDAPLRGTDGAVLIP